MEVIDLFSSDSFEQHNIMDSQSKADMSAQVRVSQSDIIAFAAL